MKTAKSIDLCNNPLTKVILRIWIPIRIHFNFSQEPKLSAARRIVSEWTDYDEEMNRLREQIDKEKHNISESSENVEDAVKKDRIEL